MDSTGRRFRKCRNSAGNDARRGASGQAVEEDGAGFHVVGDAGPRKKPAWMHSRAWRDDNNQPRFITVTYYVWRNYGAYGGVPF